MQELKSFDFVEFYVGSAKTMAYWYVRALGFIIKGYSGPETGQRQRVSYFLVQNDIKIVLTSALTPNEFEIHAFLACHGDGVKRVAYSVSNVETTYNQAITNGAQPLQRPVVLEDTFGILVEASLRVYDDTEIILRDASRYKGVFKPGFTTDIPLQFDSRGEKPNLMSIDHIVGNVRVDEMNYWERYFNSSFGFETFVNFGPGDISTKYSALLSKVVRSKNDRIKHPINEPYKGVKKSQIQEYIEEYHGSGIQHIAISTPDIIQAIRALRANGVEFLTVPDSYYVELENRAFKTVREDFNALRELGILCDIEGQGYLLQLFTKPIGDRPTFFFEIIQRCNGSQGFGQGNFQALFESIERDQERRGNF